MVLMMMKICSLNSIDDEELQEHISEAYLIANKGLNWAGDSFDLSRKDVIY